MEDKNFPPAQPNTPYGASDSLEYAETNSSAPSLYTEPKNTSPERLEVHGQGEVVETPTWAPTMRSVPFSRRKAAIVSLIITGVVIIATGLVSALFITKGKTPPPDPNKLNVANQDIPLNSELGEPFPGLQGNAEALLVNGDIISKGKLKVVSGSFTSVLSTQELSENQNITLPNASGAVCLDANNCNYASNVEQTQLQTQLAQVQAQLGQIVVPPAGVASLNNQAGAVSVQGTLNRVSVTTANGVITLSTPQALDANANVQFGNLSLGAGGQIVANTLQQTGAGNDLSLDAGSDSIVFTSSGRTFEFPASGAATQTICTSIGNCGGGGSSVTDVNGESGSITLQGTTNQVSVNTAAGVITFSTPQNINTTASPTFAALTLTGLADGNVRVVGGALTIGDVNLSTEVTNTLDVGNGGTGVAAAPANGQLLIGNGTDYTLGTLDNDGGLTIANGAGSIGLAVNYGILANTAVEGDTSLTCASGTGNLTGGGNSITLGAGGSCNNISIVNNPTFSTSVTTPLLTSTGAMNITPGGALTVGATDQAVTLQGSTAAITSTGAGNDITLTSADQIILNSAAGLDVNSEAAIGSNATVIQSYALGVDHSFGSVCAFGCAGIDIRATAAAGSVSITGVHSKVISDNAGIFSTYGFRAANPTIIGTGFSNDNYGIYVDNQTAGTRDYGLYIQGADTYALWVDAGIARFDGTLEFEGATDDSFELTVAVADPTADRTITFPDDSGTVCLSSGNCAGVGGGVTTTGGTSGTIPVFSGSQSIEDSIITQVGSTIDVNGTLTLTNALGTAYGGTGVTSTATNGQLLIGNGAGYNLATLTQGSGITVTNGAGSITVASVLGTDISTSEIVDGTILESDLSSTNAPTDNHILSYDLGSGGFTWVDPASLAGPSVDSLNSLTGGLTLQGTVGEVAISDNGTDTITVNLDANVTLLGQTIGNSEIESNAVSLGSQTTGDYVASLGSLTGLSAGGTSGEGAIPTLAVLYGSAANTAVQGDTSLTCAAGTGNLSGGGNSITLGNGGSCGNIAISDSPSFATSVTTPSLVLTGAGSNGILQIANLGQSTTYTLPDPGQATADICLSTGNCAGSGGGIIGSGTADRLAVFTGSGTIGDSSITDDGSTVTLNGNVNLDVQGTTVTVGVGSSRTGSMVLHNSTNNNTVTIQSGTTSTSYALTLPTGVGSINQCLKAQNGTGTLFWDNCSGGAGGTSGVTGLNSLDGALSLQGTAGQIDVTDNGTDTITLALDTNVSLLGQTIDLASEITGILPVASGGTGASSLNDLITLGTHTVGNYQAGTSVGDGLSLSGVAGEGWTPTISLSLQANKGLEVDVNGLSLIDCADGEILKYETTGGTWGCGADAGGSGLGDNVSVNGGGATDANFVANTPSGTNTATSWSLNTTASPDEITLNIANASNTEAGAVTTGAQTFAGEKTFNGEIVAGAGINLGTQTLQGTTAVINFNNFDVTGTGDVSAAGAITGVGVNAGSGLLQGTGGLTVAGTVTLSGLTNGFLEVDGSGAVTVGTINLGADTAGDYVATISSGNGVSAAASGEGSTPSVALSNLTSDWLQSGAFDITLDNAGSELKIMESVGGTFYAILDAGNLASDQTFTLSEGGTVVTSGNVASHATTGVNAGGGLTGDGTVGVLTLDIASANGGIVVNANDIALTLQANKGLEVDVNGLSLIDCADGEVLKYETTGGTWACGADAGSGGLGDDVLVNGSNADGANFLNTAASGTSTATAWSLNGASSPDEITLQIGNASATEAGAVTAGTQTFAGEKTFNGQIVAGAGINIGAQTLQGTTAVINFNNFDVDASGNIIAAGTINSQTLGAATSFTGTVSVATSLTTPSLILNGSSFNGNLVVESALGQATTYTLPDPGQASADICLSTGNCAGLGYSVDSVNGLVGALTLQGTANEIEITDNGSSTITIGLPSDVTIGNNLTVTTNATVGGTLQVTGSTTLGASSSDTVTVNGPVTVAAQQTITMVGGTTAQRPLSPSEGMIYYDTTTDRLLTYASGKWQGDRTTADKIVAASNSSQSARDAADYVADGISDEDEINTALTAASGGKVYLLPGTYVVDGSISVPSNTTLAGAGRGTLIEFDDIDVGAEMITNSGNTGIVIRDMRLDGRKDLNTVDGQTGIYLNGLGDGSGATAVQGGTVTGVWANNFSQMGIMIYESENNIVTGNAVMGNDNVGLLVYRSSNNNVISNNTMQYNETGLLLEWNSVGNTVTGNTAEGNNLYGFQIYDVSSNNTFTGNISRGNGGDGFYINETQDNTFTGNVAADNAGWGFYGIQNGAASNNVVNDNVVENNTIGGILFYQSHNNVVSGNKVYNNGGATFNNGIHMDDADGSSITSNHITDTSCSTDCYAIEILATNSSLYLADNTIGSGTIADAATDTIWVGQTDNNGNLRNDKSSSAFIFGGSQTAQSNSIFEIQSSSTELLFSANRTTNTLKVGNSTGTDADVTLFVLDNATADPATAANGAMYYDSTTHKFRCRENGAWVNCADGGTLAVGALDGGTANANGASITGTTVYLQSASASFAGLVNTTTQTFAGDKTFNGSATIGGDLTFTAGANHTISVATPSLDNGYNLTLQAGDATASGNYSGGNLYLQGGNSNGTGTSGSVVIKSATNAGSNPVFTIDGNMFTDQLTFAEVGTAAVLSLGQGNGGSTINLRDDGVTNWGISTSDFGTFGGTDHLGFYLGGSTQVVGLSGTDGSAIFRNSANSATAFQVQNSSGTSALSVDTSTGQIQGGNGTASAPSYSFSSAGNTNTGMFLSTTDTLGFSANGTERMTLDATGALGLGDTTPDARLEVNHTFTGTTFAADSGLIIDISDTGVTTGGDYTYGQQIQVSRTGATGGSTRATGLDVSVTGDDGGAGTSTHYGINVDLTTSTADRKYALMADGGNVCVGNGGDDGQCPASDNTNSLWIEDRLTLGVDYVTITDDGVTDTITPTSSFVYLSINETANAGIPEIRISEAGARNGDLLILVNTEQDDSHEGLNLPLVVGQQQVNGSWLSTDTTGTWDTISFIYVLDRWVEISRSLND